MTYNTTSIDNATGLDSLIVNINTAANGLPAVVVLVILWIGTYVYVTNRNLDPGEAFTATNFVVLLIAGLMMFLGMIGLYVVILITVMFFGGVIYLMFK